MADLTQTAANCRVREGATTFVGQAGEALTPGQPVYQSNNKYYKAGAGTSVKADCKGIAASYADADDLVLIVTAGTFDPGATATQGETYVCTDTDGAIGIIGDRGTGDFITSIGRGRSDGDISVAISVSGIAKP